MNSTIELLDIGPNLKRVVKFESGKWIPLGVLTQVGKDKFTIKDGRGIYTLDQALKVVGAYD